MAASLNTAKHYRDWDLTDSFDTSDIERLFKPGSSKYTKPVRCVKYWSLYASICVFFALFLSGLIVGFYIREDPKLLTQGCEKRSDGFDKEKLQAVHNNIVYYMSGDKIIDNIRLLSPDAKNLYDYWEEDRRTADIVRNKFLSFGFDHVDLEEHNVVVTSPDPSQPNRLEIIYPGGSTFYNVSENEKGDNSGRQLPPVSVISATGSVEGLVVYGGYGTPADFLGLHTSRGALLQDAVVLLKMGLIPISEKVELAKDYRMAAVLLFCEEEEGNHRNQCHGNQLVSWDDFMAQNGQIKQSIPVQVISQTVARQLIEVINSTSTWPEDSHQQKQDDGTSVRLHVGGSTVSKKVYNVVGTIRGSEEPDRIVMVVAGRQSYPSCCYDDLLSTALLLEMGNSFRVLEGWKPRRTIKLVSLGGHNFASSGLLNYIKGHYQEMDTDTVAFIDLDLSQNGSDLLTYASTPSLEKLVHRAASMVPDPADPDLSLTDSWPEYRNSYPSMYYGGSVLPLIQQLGIPSVSIQGIQIKDSEILEGSQRDVTHHYKYHLATTRVVSHMLLQLSDWEHLPLDVKFLSDIIQQLVLSTVEQLKQIVTEKDRELLQAAANALSKSTASFPFHPSQTCWDVLQTRELNDMLMHLDKIFYHTTVANRTQHHQYLLQQVPQTGSLYMIGEAVRIYNITGNSKPVQDIVHLLIKAINEANQKISTYQSR